MKNELIWAIGAFEKMLADRIDIKSKLAEKNNEIERKINEIGAMLVPEDAKPQEKFSVWVENNLVEVTVLGNGNDYHVAIRKRK